MDLCWGGGLSRYGASTRDMTGISLKRGGGGLEGGVFFIKLGFEITVAPKGTPSGPTYWLEMEVPHHIRVKMERVWLPLSTTRWE